MIQAGEFNGDAEHEVLSWQIRPQCSLFGLARWVQMAILGSVAGQKASQRLDFPLHILDQEFYIFHTGPLSLRCRSCSKSCPHGMVGTI